MQVQQILKSKSDDGVVTVVPGSLVSEAAQVLAARKIGALIVSPDGKRIAGILSERDIVRELGKRGGAVLNDRVAQLMTRAIVSCSPEDRADEVLEKMTNGRFRHMPVMKGDQMIGLISIGDVVKARLADLESEKDALEGMIRGA